MAENRSLETALRAPSSIRLLWLATFLVDALVVILVGFAIAESREREVDHARVEARNYASVLEESFRGFLDKTDLALMTLSDELARQRRQRGGIDAESLSRFISRQDGFLPGTLGLRVVDAEGVIRYAASNVRVKQASIADRPQFIRMRTGRSQGLVFSKPVLGRAAMTRLITVSRRIENPDGSFAGDVHVAVSLDYLIEELAKIDLGEHGNDAIWDDSTLIARYSRDDPHGANIGATTPSANLRAILAAGPSEAVYHARSGIDGITRVYCVRRVGTYPLFVIAGLADQDYLAKWQRDSLFIGGLSAVFVVVSVLFTWLFTRSLRQREIDHELLHRQEMQYSAKLEVARHEAEEARQRNDLILGSVGEGICGIDAAGNIIFINPAARRMFGWSDSEGGGCNLHHSTHARLPDGSPYPAAQCPINKTLQDGQWRQVSDDVFWRNDDVAFPVDYIVSAIERDGQTVGAVISFRDVSERKQAELEYRAILQTAIDGYLLVDSEGRFIDTNEAYCAMLGYSRDELLHMAVRDVEAIESPDEARRHTEEIFRNGHARFESRHRRKDGSVIDVEVSTSYIDYRGGVLITFIRDVSDRKRDEQQIRQLAYFDTLTNLPNRRMMMDRLVNALAQAKRYRRSLAVLFLDLDRFKQVNDTLGHDAGDELLCQVARRLNGCVRAGDTVSRQGGDEFVILLPEIANPYDAEGVAEKIMAAVSAPMEIHGRALEVTTSIGIAVYPVNGRDDALELMKKADHAMYQAKESGRNAYRFYRDEGGSAPA